jgi:hypothetical protein
VLRAGADGNGSFPALVGVGDRAGVNRMDGNRSDGAVLFLRQPENRRDEMTTRAKNFMAANADSPIVNGAWLDKDKRPPTGRRETWVYFRLQLESGDVFMLDEADKAAIDAAGYRLKWLILEASHG